MVIDVVRLEIGLLFYVNAISCYMNLNREYQDRKLKYSTELLLSFFYLLFVQKYYRLSHHTMTHSKKAESIQTKTFKKFSKAC